MSLEIVTRNMWGATPVRANVANARELVLPLKYIFFTYTKSQECKSMMGCNTILKGLQDRAMRFMSLADIFYSFMIGGDGKVYEGRGFYLAPMLPGRHRFIAETSLYIAYIGMFKERRPSSAMRKSRYLLTEYAAKMGILDPNYQRVDLVARNSSEIVSAHANSFKSQDRYDFTS